MSHSSGLAAHLPVRTRKIDPGKNRFTFGVIWVNIKKVPGKVFNQAVNELIKIADQSLYKAKALGKNQVIHKQNE